MKEHDFEVGDVCEVTGDCRFNLGDIVKVSGFDAAIDPENCMQCKRVRDGLVSYVYYNRLKRIVGPEKRSLTKEEFLAERILTYQDAQAALELYMKPVEQAIMKWASTQEDIPAGSSIQDFYPYEYGFVAIFRERWGDSQTRYLATETIIEFLDHEP